MQHRSAVVSESIGKIAAMYYQFSRHSMHVISQKAGDRSHLRVHMSTFLTQHRYCDHESWI
jgi:hypothetical protein